MTRAILGLACAATACIPDRGLLADAAVEAPPLWDHPPPRDAPLPDKSVDGAGGGDAGGSGGGGSGGGGGIGGAGGMGGGAGADALPSVCSKADLTIEAIGLGTMYTVVKPAPRMDKPNEVDVAAGTCVELCVENPGGEPHKNQSEDGLFEDFEAGGGEKKCALFVRPLTARAEPYVITCQQHFGMVIRIWVK